MGVDLNVTLPKHPEILGSGESHHVVGSNPRRRSYSDSAGRDKSRMRADREQVVALLTRKMSWTAGGVWPNPKSAP